MIEFEWNHTKAESNLKKHGVSFDEAKSVFYDEFAVQFYDEENSATEDRFLMLGISNESRMLLVCHCEKAESEKEESNLIRIISARKATRQERKSYTGGVL